MNAQNLHRLRAMAKRLMPRAPALADLVADTAFLEHFARVRDNVLAPVLREIGAELHAAGGPDHIVRSSARGRDGIALQLLIAGSDTSNTIRFVPRKDAAGRWWVIGESQMRRSPTEIARYEADAPVTREVVEHVVVDALEQVLAAESSAAASTGGAS